MEDICGTADRFFNTKPARPESTVVRRVSIRVGEGVMLADFEVVVEADARSSN